MNKNERKAIFSRNLKELIYKSGHAQGEVAKACGIGEKCFSTYSIGRTLPPVKKLKAIADYFGVSAEYLLTEHLDEVKQITELEVIYNRLNDDDKQTLLLMARTLYQKPEYSLADKKEA